MKRIYRFCKKYLMHKRKHIIFFIIICIINNLVFIVLPYLTGNFIDQLVNNTKKNFFLNYSIIFTILSLSELLLGYISNRMYMKLQTEMAYSLNVDIIQHMHKMPLMTIENLDAASLTQKISNDSNALIAFCMNVLQQIVINIIQFIAAFAYIFYINSTLAVIFFLLSSIYLIAYELLKKHVARLNYTLKEDQANFFSKLYEQLSNSKFIRLHGIVQLFTKRLDNAFFRVLDTSLKYQKINYLFASVDKIITLFSTLMIFIWGGKSVIEGTLTIGQFTIISSYFMIMKSAIKYFFQLGQNIQETLVSCNRLQDILNIKEQSCGNEILSSIDSISIKNLTFSYNDNPIFIHFNLEFKKGKIYAITGKNGAGKSTLIDILLGLYMDEFSGEVLYNEKSIKSLNMISIRRKLVGISEQEPLLLNDTLKYNLTFGDNDLLQKNKLDNLFQIFNLQEFIYLLPERLNMVINEKSNNLSGGEKQKMSLIRTFLRDSDVLILDEPTSAIDKDSQLKLMEYLISTCNDKIVIISTHSKDLIKLCDVVIEL